jgi:adenosylhomocysteine nucleosidase
MDEATRAAVAEALAGFEALALPPAATGAEARKPRLHFGTVLTGDQFINSEEIRAALHARFGAQAVEMEGAAVAQVCERFARDCVVVRCLSDLAGHESHMDILAFLAFTAENAAAVVRRLLPAL